MGQVGLGTGLCNEEAPDHVGLAQNVSEVEPPVQDIKILGFLSLSNVLADRRSPALAFVTKSP